MLAHSRSFVHEPKLAPIRSWMWFASLSVFVIALLLDGYILRSIPAPGNRLSDMQRLLRIAGYIPTWFVLVSAFVLASSGSRRRVRAMTVGGYVLMSAGISGGVAALLKIVVRRPDLRFGAGYEGWETAPLGDRPFDGTDLCFPSEHVAVAFGATLMLARLYPGASPLLLALGFGTAVVRVREWGHHPSDTMGSLVVALGVVALVPCLMRRASRALSTDSAVAPLGAQRNGVMPGRAISGTSIEPNS
ncbi:MAG: phosphatase PAP2 family protein [Planctomycetota bacterium]